PLLVPADVAACAEVLPCLADAAGATAVPPTCAVPAESVEELPPPTCAAPTLRCAELPEPVTAIGAVTDAVLPAAAADAPGLALVGPTCTAPTEPPAELPSASTVPVCASATAAAAA